MPDFATIGATNGRPVRLQLFALAYNLANFLRSLALPDAANGK